MLFTDSHCHINFPEFDQTRTGLLTQCRQKNIHRIIVPATTPNTWQSVLELSKHTAKQSPALFPCLGIHPWFLTSLKATHLDELAKEVETHGHYIVAIGETGIDQVIANEQNNLSQQQTFFQFQIALANQVNLPIIIHHRRSHQHVLSMLKHYPVNNGGVIHAFSGSYQQAKAYLDLGFKLGIGGTITYPRAEKTINTVKRVPLDSILLETDAPAMPLYGFQGQDNTPLQLINVFEKLCEIRDETPQIIAMTIEDNVDSLFFHT